MDVFYEVTVKNRTREDLAGARADYVVIMENTIKIYRTSSGRPETFDSESGEILWKTRLPASGHATPMTYRLRPDGRQFGDTGCSGA